jgi:hypothetical protein
VIVAAAPKPEPVFVHCMVGRDRTGLFVAAYRIALDDLGTEKALAEMDAYGHDARWFPLHAFIRSHAAGWRGGEPRMDANERE